MDSTIVELSRYTASNTASNAQWTNNSIKSITVEQGDVIMIKQCFIDCTIVDSTSIWIQEDTSITFQFMYWIQGHGINQYAYNDSGEEFAFPPDGLPYMLIDRGELFQNPMDFLFMPQLNARPVINSKTVNVKAGIYERQSLAELITRQLTEINQPTTLTLNTQFFSNGFSVPQWGSDGLFSNITPPQDAPKSTQVISPFQIPLYWLEYILNAPGPVPPVTEMQMLCYLDAQNKLRPCQLVKMTDSPNYPVYANTLHIKSESSIGYINYNSTQYEVWDAGMIGCSEIALEFNQTGDNTGKFSFTYMHSPLINEGNETVGTYSVADVGGDNPFQNLTTFLNAYSGIMFLNVFEGVNSAYVSPAFGPPIPLLNQMGFDRNDLIPPDVPKVFGLDNLFVVEAEYYFKYYESFIPYTTRNFSAQTTLNKNSTSNLAGFNTKVFAINNYNCIVNATNNGSDGYSFTDSASTDPLRASNFPIASDDNTGHYLIELNGYNTNYVNNEKLYFIKAIVGSYMYSTESFAMSLSPDSLVYMHNSPVPLSINQIDIRILNPKTKLPEVNLGPNSSLYLQITHEVQPPQEVKPTKKEESKK